MSDIPNSHVLNETFVRTTVLEALFVEILGATSSMFEDDVGFRTALFQAVRQRFSERLANPKAFGEAEYLKLALKVTDDIERGAIAKLGGGEAQG